MFGTGYIFDNLAESLTKQLMNARTLSKSYEKEDFEVVRYTNNAQCGFTNHGIPTGIATRIVFNYTHFFNILDPRVFETGTKCRFQIRRTVLRPRKL